MPCKAIRVMHTTVVVSLAVGMDHQAAGDTVMIGDMGRVNLGQDVVNHLGS